MQFPIFSKIAKNKICWSLFVILSGITFGYFILRLFSRLPLTYATFSIAAIVSPFLAIILRNPKRLLWSILVVCLPVTVDKQLNGGWHSGTAGYLISLFDMVLAVLYLLWFVEMISKRKVDIKYYPSISIPAMTLLGIACLSIIRAKRPEFCIYEIIEVIKMFLTFLYLANNIKTNNDIKFITYLLILGLLFEGVLGFAQHRYGEPFFPSALGGPSRIDQRIMGTWLSFNDFAWYLTFVLPIALCILFSEINYLYKLFPGFALFFGFGAIIWTNSRGGWISLAGSLIYVCPFLFSKINGKIGLIKTFTSIIALIIFVSPLYPRLYTKIYGRFSADDRGSSESRWPQYNVALNIIKENPIIGVGINNYTFVMRDYDTTEEGITSYTYHAVHNIFLHIAAEMGILGIITYLWLIAVMIIVGVKYIISNEGFNVYVVIGLTAGILAFCIHGLVDTASIGNKLQMFVWFYAGIVFAIAKTKKVSIQTQ